MNRFLYSLLAFVLCATASVRGEDVEALKSEIALLKLRNSQLQKSLIEANQREKDAADALARIKLRLEALGKNLIDDSDDRHVTAVEDLFVLNGEIEKTREAAALLTESMQAYLKTAIASDPDARALVETRLREMEVELGLRTKPAKNIERGSLQQAKVKSIDEKSGLVVLNVGDNAKARIGMIFNIKRDDQLIAEVMVAETRPDCCGVFVQRLENDKYPVRFNDTASLKTN